MIYRIDRLAIDRIYLGTKREEEETREGRKKSRKEERRKHGQVLAHENKLFCKK